MNWVDIVVMVLFVACAGLGFIQGFARLLIALVGIYIGFVVAAASYRPLAESLASLSGTMNPVTAEIVAFSTLLTVTSVMLVVAGLSLFKHFRLPKPVAVINQIGGIFLGLVTGTLALTLGVLISSFGVVLLHYAIVSVEPNWMFLKFVSTDMQSSATVPFFLHLTPFLSTFISPWAPMGLPVFMKA